MQKPRPHSEELLLAVEDPDTIGMIRRQKFLAPLLNPETFESLFDKMDLNSARQHLQS